MLLFNKNKILCFKMASSDYGYMFYEGKKVYCSLYDDSYIKFWTIMCLFSFVSRHFLISSLISLLTKNNLEYMTSE